MELNSIKRVYFVGIGGIGMSALARYFHKRGCEVSGYDRTSTVLTNELIAEGIPVVFEDTVDSVLFFSEEPLSDVVLTFSVFVLVSVLFSGLLFSRLLFFRRFPFLF